MGREAGSLRLAQIILLLQSPTNLQATLTVPKLHVAGLNWEKKPIREDSCPKGAQRQIPAALLTGSIHAA